MKTKSLSWVCAYFNYFGNVKICFEKQSKVVSAGCCGMSRLFNIVGGSVINEGTLFGVAAF